MTGPRLPDSERDEWGSERVPGVRLRVGRNSIFIAERHLASVIFALEQHAAELRRLGDPGGRHRTPSQWRNLARSRALVITALEHQLDAATSATTTVPAPAEHEPEGTS